MIELGLRISFFRKVSEFVMDRVDITTAETIHSTTFCKYVVNYHPNLS